MHTRRSARLGRFNAAAEGRQGENRSGPNSYHGFQEYPPATSIRAGVYGSIEDFETYPGQQYGSYNQAYDGDLTFAPEDLAKANHTSDQQHVLSQQAPPNTNNANAFTPVPTREPTRTPDWPRTMYGGRFPGVRSNLDRSTYPTPLTRASGYDDAQHYNMGNTGGEGPQTEEDWQHMLDPGLDSFSLHEQNDHPVPQAEDETMATRTGRSRAPPSHTPPPPPPLREPSARHASVRYTCTHPGCTRDFATRSEMQ